MPNTNKETSKRICDKKPINLISMLYFDDDWLWVIVPDSFPLHSEALYIELMLHVFDHKAKFQTSIYNRATIGPSACQRNDK